MRYDEIDLNLDGKLTIQGVQGGNKNLIQYKDGLVSWVTASTPTAIDSLIRNIGNLFQIVESVSGDSVASGQRLIDAYAKVVADEASLNLSQNNRYTLLLTPGLYDIRNYLEITISYVDVVGLSTNPMNTKLTSDNQSYAINFTGLNHKIKNLNLGYASLGCIGFGTTYLMGENLVISSNPFTGEDLRGVFKDIKVLPSANFCIGHSSIDAIFDNIYFEGISGQAFLSGSSGRIQGTFSNVTFEYQSNNIFYYTDTSDYDVIINLNNFKILDGGSYDFINVGGTLSGTFENVYVNTSGLYIINVPNAGILGNWKNIELRGRSCLSYFSCVYIDGVFDNIKIISDDLNATSYVFSPTNYLSGTYSNIYIDTPNTNQNSSIFSAQTSPFYHNISVNNLVIKSVFGGIFSPAFINGTVSGTYKNLDLSESYSVFSLVNYGSLTGEFENITIKQSNFGAFNAPSGSLKGSFKNIKIENCRIAQDYFTSIELTGEFENISNFNYPDETPSTFFFTNTENKGNFKKLNLNAKEIFQSGGTISCAIEDSVFICENLLNPLYSIIGTFSNILLNSATVSNIFNSSTGHIDGRFENIFIKDYYKLFTANRYLNGNYKNLRIGNNLGAFDVFSVQDINAEFEDIIIGDGNSYDIFKSGVSIRGKFSNIRFGNNWNYIFTTTNEISGKFKDLYIPNTVTNYSFQATSMSYSTIFDNVKNYNLFGVPFNGVMSNCVMSDPNIQIIESNYEPFEVDFTSTVLIENTDFYYYGSIEIPTFVSSYFVIGDIFNIYAFDVGDVHILNCGLGVGFPASQSFFEFPSDRGITPILGAGAYNVIGIPKPK